MNISPKMLAEAIQEAFERGYKRAVEEMEGRGKQRAKWREIWHARKKPKAYVERKRDQKAEWQAANPEKNVAYVQAFRERWGRWPAKAEKKTAASADTGKKEKPANASRSLDTGGKVTKKAAKPKPKAKPARRAPSRKARRP